MLCTLGVSVSGHTQFRVTLLLVDMRTTQEHKNAKRGYTYIVIVDVRITPRAEPQITTSSLNPDNRQKYLQFFSSLSPSAKPNFQKSSFQSLVSQIMHSARDVSKSFVQNSSPSPSTSPKFQVQVQVPAEKFKSKLPPHPASAFRHFHAFQ